MTLFLPQFYKKSEGMVAFLQTDIGVKQSLWAKSIVDHIEKPILEGEKEDASTAESEGPEATRKKPLTFCVEGNISVGKSTFLRQIVSKTFLLKVGHVFCVRLSTAVRLLCAPLRSLPRSARAFIAAYLCELVCAQPTGPVKWVTAVFLSLPVNFTGFLLPQLAGIRRLLSKG